MEGKSVKKKTVKKAAKKNTVVKKRAIRKPGRPLTLTTNLGEELCKRLIERGSLRNVCSDNDMPAKTTVFRWLLRASQTKTDEIYIEFRDQYTHAREFASDYSFDELIHTLNETALQPVMNDGAPLIVKGEIVRVPSHISVQLAKLHLDAYKWKTSKENPKKYGDRMDLNHGGQVDNPIRGLINSVSNVIKPNESD